MRVETLVRPLARPGGALAGLLTVTRDVTHRPEPDDALRRSQARLRVGLALAPVTVFSHDAALRYTWASGGFLALDADTLVGQTDADLLPDDEARALADLKREVLDTGLAARRDVQLTTLAGPRHYRLYLAPVLDDDGVTVTGLTGAAHDVTEQRQADALFDAGAGSAFQILDSISDAFFALDDDWRFLYLNEQAQTLFRRPMDGLLGETLWDVFPQIVGTPFEEKFRVAVRNNVTIQLTHYYRALDAWVEAKAFPFEGGLSVYFADVTARRQAEMALYEGQEWAASVLKALGDAFFALDADGLVTIANAEAAALVGAQPGDLIGAPFDEALPPLAASVLDDHLRRAAREATDVQRTDYLDALGRWFEVKAFPYEEGLSVYLTDVTARKEAEAALRESRRRYRLALDAAGLGEIDLDVQTGRLVRSPLVDRFFGLTPGATPDSTDADADADADDDADGAEARDDRLLPLARRVHPDDLAALRASLAALADTPADADGGPAAWGHTFRVVHPDGSVHRLRVRADVLHAPDGTPARLIGVCGRAPTPT